MDTLRKNNYPYAYELVVYENAGEPFWVLYVIPAGINQICKRLLDKFKQLTLVRLLCFPTRSHQAHSRVVDRQVEIIIEGELQN
jgi:hypothetical protein